MPAPVTRSNTDPVADMLTRMRNAVAVGKQNVIVPYARQHAAILAQLKKYGFIAGYKVDQHDQRLLCVQLGSPTAPSRIQELQRVSKPGRRQYVKAGDIHKVRGGRGLCLVSTSAGIMSGDEAKQKGLGGELIAKVW